MQVLEKPTDVTADGVEPRRATEAQRWLFCWSLFVCLGVVLGFVSFLRLGLTEDRLVRFLQGGCRQLGVIGLALTVGTLMVGRLRQWARPDAAVHRANVVWLKLLAAAGVSLLVAEVFMRAVFFDGASIGWGTGPIVERFRRHYHVNRFGSRGPDAIGPKAPGTLRVMVQGDSITFGNGLKDEREVYPSLVLDGLQRAALSRVEMSVHAAGGYHINTHLDNLQRFGPEVAPDLLIYQWHPNDVDLDSFSHPEVRGRVWARLFYHELFQRVSYAWWFFDYVLTNRLPRARSPIDEPFAKDYFIVDQWEWTAFKRRFRAWAASSRQHSPRAVLLLYPAEMESPEAQRSSSSQFWAIRSWVKDAASDYDIQTVDLLEYLGDVQDWREVAVGRFDLHPNAFIHRRMAEVLLGWIPVWWPELFSGTSRELVSRPVDP